MVIQEHFVASNNVTFANTARVVNGHFKHVGLGKSRPTSFTQWLQDDTTYLVIRGIIVHSVQPHAKSSFFCVSASLSWSLFLRQSRNFRRILLACQPARKPVAKETAIATWRVLSDTSAIFTSVLEKAVHLKAISTVYVLFDRTLRLAFMGHPCVYSHVICVLQRASQYNQFGVTRECRSQGGYLIIIIEQKSSIIHDKDTIINQRHTQLIIRTSDCNNASNFKSNIQHVADA